MFSTVAVAVLEDGRVSQEFHFGEGQMACMVGRSSDCDLVLPCDFLHGNVSRRHCRIEVRPSGVWVRDLGSRNGTYVNGICIGGREFARWGEPGRRFLLQSGDQVRIGDTVLRVEAEAGVRANEAAGDPVSKA
jgi:pSer/pThr/pTyr-binding forkhead associated (FHA) protein